MDKRNPKQTCANCAYFTYKKDMPWTEDLCFFPLTPTEEPEGVPVNRDDYCKEWTYYAAKKVEPEPFRDFAFVDGYLTGLTHRLQRLEEKVHGLEQVITELVAAIGMKKD